MYKLSKADGLNGYNQAETGIFFSSCFLPKAISEDKYGGRDAPLFGYMEIPRPTPPPPPRSV